MLMKKKIMFVFTIVLLSAYFPVDREKRAPKVGIYFVNFIEDIPLCSELKNNSLDFRQTHPNFIQVRLYVSV